MTTAKKTTTKKATAAKKAPAKKTTAVKKTAVKKAAAKKAVAKKTVSKKTPVKKAAVKKAAVKKAAPKKAVKKETVKKTTVKKTAAKKAPKETYAEAVQAAAGILFELRAQKLQLLDLRGLSEMSASDFMLIATCESEAQMQAILDALTQEFKARGWQHNSEYKPGINMRWAVFDAGFDVMVQLFEETKREELAFDKLYGDARITDLAEKDFVREPAKKAKTENELI